jgi:hypothetical protein
LCFGNENSFPPPNKFIYRMKFTSSTASGPRGSCRAGHLQTLSVRRVAFRTGGRYACCRSIVSFFFNRSIVGFGESRSGKSAHDESRSCSYLKQGSMPNNSLTKRGQALRYLNACMVYFRPRGSNEKDECALAPSFGCGAI